MALIGSPRQGISTAAFLLLVFPTRFTQYLDLPACKTLSVLIFRRIRKTVEKRVSALSCLSVHPSFHLEQLCSYWTDFHEILYL